MSASSTQTESPLESRANVPVAAFLVAMALLCNHWLIGALFSPTGNVDEFAARCFIWCFQAGLLFFAVTFFRKGGTASGRKHILFSAILLLIMVSLCELSVALLGTVAERLTAEAERKETLDPRLLRSPYDDKPWAIPLFEEEAACRRQYYESYYLWRRGAFEGKHINISADGVRKSWNPTGLAEPPTPSSLYFLGGSTAWGTGARDEHTIPSYLSRTLSEAGHPVLVSNYGETGYTMTQEFVRLLMLLREGHRPDTVVFYDGVNEVYAAYKTGIPGTDIRYRVFRKLLTDLNPPTHSLREDLYLAVTGLLEAHCHLYQLVSEIPPVFQSFFGDTEGSALQQEHTGDLPAARFTEAGATIDRERLDTLALGIVDYYVASAALLEGLSQVYGFDYQLFWQPVLFTESHLSEEEATAVRFRDKSLGYLYDRVYFEIRTRDIAHFHDISDALAARQESVYIDFCHIAEEGNRLVAQRMGSVLLENALPAE